jgi:DNA-directed RNA polymerase specialized sigma subunit
MNYTNNKEMNAGLIRVPSHRLGTNDNGYEKANYEYVGLEECEGLVSESSEFRGFEIEDMGVELNRVMGSLLTPKERHVIEMSFGLLSYEEMNYNEIGTELELGYEMVRKIKVRAMDKLKDYFITNL